MTLRMIFEEFKEKLSKNIKNVICFKTFEKNKSIINVCCLQGDINLKDGMENFKFFSVKHCSNFVYNVPKLIKINSLKKFFNSHYKFIFSKKTLNNQLRFKKNGCSCWKKNSFRRKKEENF